jgi:hypothetical protein
MSLGHRLAGSFVCRRCAQHAPKAQLYLMVMMRAFCLTHLRHYRLSSALNPRQTRYGRDTHNSVQRPAPGAAILPSPPGAEHAPGVSHIEDKLIVV